MDDLRIREAVRFAMPESFSGPCYFLFESRQPDGEEFGLAVFLDSGFDRHGVSLRPPFSRIAVRKGVAVDTAVMSCEQLRTLAGVALDLVDVREKAHLTINAAGSSHQLQTASMFSGIPAEQLRRLVGALLDSADALEGYARVGRFPARPHHL